MIESTSPRLYDHFYGPLRTTGTSGTRLKPDLLGALLANAEFSQHVERLFPAIVTTRASGDHPRKNSGNSRNRGKKSDRFVDRLG